MNDAAQVADALALPQQAYLPGLTPRPPETFFDTPDLKVDGKAGSHTVAWHYGLRLFRNGFYWEAHEVLEPVWLACAPNSRERYTVQAVIQLSNAALKLRLQKPGAADRLIAIASDLLTRAGSGASAFGLDPAGCASYLSGIDRRDEDIETQLVAAVVRNMHDSAIYSQRNWS